MRGRWRRRRERAGHVPAVMRAGIIVLILGVGRRQAGRDHVEHRAALQIPDHLRCPALQLQSTRVSGPRLVRVLGLGSYGGQAFLVRGVGVIVLGDLQPQDALGAADQLHHVVVRHLADVVAVDGDQVVAGAQAGALRRAALHDAAEDARLLARYREAEALRAADHLDCPHPVVHSLLLPPVLMHICLPLGWGPQRHEGPPGRRARSPPLPRDTSRWLANSILRRPHASTSASILLPDVPPRSPSITARMDSLPEVWNELSLFSAREKDPPQRTGTPSSSPSPRHPWLEEPRLITGPSRWCPRISLRSSGRGCHSRETVPDARDPAGTAVPTRGNHSRIDSPIPSPGGGVGHESGTPGRALFRYVDRTSLTASSSRADVLECVHRGG